MGSERSTNYPIQNDANITRIKLVVQDFVKQLTKSEAENHGGITAAGGGKDFPLDFWPIRDMWHTPRHESYERCWHVQV